MAHRDNPLSDDPLWYKDAIIYQLHVKSFFDGNDDGVGDFAGLVRKLDYLQDLGVTALWLLPFYPSPLRDDGYDTADYRKINPAYGTIRDFREFLRQAHKRGMRVITELVLNHTSDQHPWFQRARKSRSGSAWRDFYVWSDSPHLYGDARIIFPDFETSNWTYDPVAQAYYWHRFYSHQPDLNFDSSKVQEALFGALDHWFGMGVDGMRLDAVPYLYERENTNCENLPETHEFLKKLRRRLDEKFQNRMLLAEANQWPEDAVAYFGEGDECHMAFHFPIMPRMFMALQMEDSFPIFDILDPPLIIPESCQWAMFLRNHDELTLEMVTDEERDYMYRVYARETRAKINLGIRRRLAPLLGNNRDRIELMNILLFSLPGTPIIYYGDEIGMGDNYYLGDRDGVRTPMQWSPDRNAGFSRCNPQKLFLPAIIDPEYHYEALNVENQERNLTSLLWWMKRVIALRKRYQAFGRGDMTFITVKNPKILAFERSYNGERVIVIVNLSPTVQLAELDLSFRQGMVPVEIFSRNPHPALGSDPYRITLGPYNYYLFELHEETGKTAGDAGGGIPRISVQNPLEKVLTPRFYKRLEQEIFSDYLSGARWFGGKARRIRDITIRESIRVLRDKPIAHILILQVQYTDGAPESYLLPFFYVSRDAGEAVMARNPETVIAILNTSDGEGILYDGIQEPDFHSALLEILGKSRRLRGDGGQLAGLRGKKFREILGKGEVELRSSVTRAQQSNSSIMFEDRFVLKLIRKLEEGLNPDEEIVRHLTEKVRFRQIPSFAGMIQYRKEGGDPITVGLLQEFVANQGDGWDFFLGQVSGYLDKILARAHEIGPPPEQSSELGSPLEGEKGEMAELIGEFGLHMTALLGQRTGELHEALARPSDNPAFSPEPFSLLYQRSIYQSVGSLVRKTFSLLRSRTDGLAEDESRLAAEVLSQQSSIRDRLERLLRKKISAAKIRVHGDYHLGQTLFTGKDFVILDFEGEPARPLGERRLKRSALRDVAGMIRSFHYVAHMALLHHRTEDMPLLQGWVLPWFNTLSGLFLTSYIETVRHAAFIPEDQEDLRTLLDVYLIEKAVYEIGYEMNNRPDWVSIPLRGLIHLMKDSS